MPFVVDRRRKSLFPNGSRHSAPFALPRTVGDTRREQKGEREERESLGFNLHSILIPIRYRGFPFL